MANKTKFHGIHITHNDADAVGCAFVLKYFNPDFDYEKNTYFCAIGTQDKVLNDILDSVDKGEADIPESIVISDLSLSEETCDKIFKFAQFYGVDIHGYDHHKTNTLGADYDWWLVKSEPVHIDGVGDVDISATKIMYDVMKHTRANNEKIDMLVEMISNYDTWMWRKYPSFYEDGIEEDIVAVTCSMLRPDKMFEALLEHYSNDTNNGKMFPDIFYTIYNIEVDKRNTYLRSLLYKARVIEHKKGVKIALFICENNYSNSAAEYIYNNYDIDIVIPIYPASSKIGLRTKRDDLDLGKIARDVFGSSGGGHPKAAGATVESSEFVKLLNIYYTKTISLKEFIER